MSFKSNQKKILFPNIMVFDLETGGFSKDKNPIIEFAAIMLDSELSEIDRLEFVVLPYNPELEYTAGALKANGFTMGEIEKRGIPSDEAVKLLVDFMAKHQSKTTPSISYQPDRKVVISGHNIDKFDIPFLETFLKAHKVDMWKYISPMTLDTLKMARYNFGFLDYPYSTHSLIDCCKYIKYEIIDAHRAMNDVEGNIRLLKHFISSTRGQNAVLVEQEETERFRNSFKIG